MSKEETVIYQTAVFRVEQGFYSIAQLEDMIKEFKTQKTFQDKMLAKSMEKKQVILFHGLKKKIIWDKAND